MPRLSSFYGIGIWLYWNQEWARLHADESAADWERASADQPLLPIDPLA